MKRALCFLFIFATLFSASPTLAWDVTGATKNVARYVTFPIYKNDGTLLSGATGLDTECDFYAAGSAPDGFADVTNEAAEIGSTGWYYIQFTQEEMNNDLAACQVKSSSTGAVATPLNISTLPLQANIVSADTDSLEPGDFAADGVLASVDGTTIGLASGAVDADDQFNNGWRIDFRGADRQGSSCITDSTNSGDTVVIADTLSPAPTTGDDYVIYSDATCDPALLTSINAEMLDVLSTDENAELAALPGASPTILEMLQFVYEYLRNKVTVTSSSETVYKNDSSTAIGERTLSDNGTTFSKTRVTAP